MDRTERIKLVRILGLLLLIVTGVVIADAIAQRVAIFAEYRGLIGAIAIIAFYLDLVINKRYEGIVEWFLNIEHTE